MDNHPQCVKRGVGDVGWSRGAAARGALRGGGESDSPAKASSGAVNHGSIPIRVHFSVIEPNSCGFSSHRKP